MLITFSSKAHHDVVMFGDIGLAMLKGMGMSERVPGAVRAADVPRALESLRDWLERQNRKPADEKDEDEDGDGDGDGDEQERVPVSLAKRALPLIEMLEAARREEADVIWE